MKHTILFILFLTGFNTFSQSFNLQSGINHYQEEKYDEAVQYLTKEINKNPKEGTAYYYLALTYLKKEDIKEGLTHINLAINHLSTEDTLTGFAWKLKGDMYYQLKETEKFDSCYSKAISLKPNSIEFYLDRAIKYEDQKQFDKAIKDILKILDLDETNTVSRLLWARVFVKQNKFNEALNLTNIAIEINSSDALAYLIRSQIYYKLGKFDLAIIDAFQAFSLDEDDSRYQENFIEMSTKNYDLALSKMAPLIKESPRKDNWRYVRSQLYQNKKDFKNALLDMNILFENTPDNFINYYLLDRAVLFSQMGMPNRSIKDLTKMISMDSSSSYDYYQRSEAYRYTGKYTNAIADLNKAIELDPKEALYYNQRGWIKYKFLNKPSEGLNDFNMGIKLDSNCAACYLNRGRIYLKQQNDVKRANLDFQKVVELDTIVDSNGNSRSFGYFELGQIDKAQEWMSKILLEAPHGGNYYDAACLYSLIKKPKLALSALEMAFQKGFRKLSIITTDTDLDYIRHLPEFKSLIYQWKLKINKAKTHEAKFIDFNKNTNIISGTYRIPFKSGGGGLMKVDLKINGMPVEMILDTGASDISISQTELDFMLKNKYISKQDMIGKDSYSLANGVSHISQTFMLKKIEIGGLTIKNVKGSFSENPKASLLLGQNLLRRFGKVTIDYGKKQIVLQGSGG